MQLLSDSTGSQSGRYPIIIISHVQQALIHEKQKLQTQLQSLSTSSYESQPASALLGGHRETKINKVKCFEFGQAAYFCRECPKGKIYMVV